LESKGFATGAETGVPGVVFDDSDGVELRTLNVEVDSSLAGGEGLDGATGVSCSVGAPASSSVGVVSGAEGEETRFEAWARFNSGSWGDECLGPPVTSSHGIEDATPGEPRYPSSAA